MPTMSLHMSLRNAPFFVIRATDAKLKRLLGDDLPDEEVFDIRVTRYLTRSQSKKKYLHPESAGQYRYICKDVAFDYLPAETYEGEHFPIRTTDKNENYRTKRENALPVDYTRVRGGK